MFTKFKDEPNMFYDQRGGAGDHATYCRRGAAAEHRRVWHMEWDAEVESEEQSDKKALAISSTATKSQMRYWDGKGRLIHNHAQDWNDKDMSSIDDTRPSPSNQWMRADNSHKWDGFVSETVCKCKNEDLREPAVFDHFVDEHGIIKEEAINDPYCVVLEKEFPYTQEEDYAEHELHSL